LRPDPTGTSDTIQPVEILLAAQEYATQHHGRYLFRILAGIAQRQRRPPGATKQHPAIDPQMLAQRFHIADQVVGGVIDKAGRWRRTPGAALVKQDDAPVLRVKKTTQMR